MTALFRALDAAVARGDAPAAAGVLFGSGRVRAVHATGLRRLPDLPLTPDTKVRVASVSKLAVAMACVTLDALDLLDLDADLSERVGFRLRHPDFPDTPITLRMVLSHVSGVRDGEDYRGVVGETLAAFFDPASPRWAGGAHWARGLPTPIGHFTYSNLGMGLAAQAVERTTGQRFDLAVRDLVFAPLGVDCGFNWAGVPDAAAEGGGTLYRRAGGGAWRVQVDGDPGQAPLPALAAGGRPLSEYVIGENGLVFSPQGGLRASILDLAGLARGLTAVGVDSISPYWPESARVRALATEWSLLPDGSNGDSSGGAFRNFATGIHVLEPSPDGPIPGLQYRLVGHYGDAYGLLAGLWVRPEDGLGFAWFVTGSPDAPAKGASGIYALEEAMMQAAAADLGLSAR